MSDPKTKDAIKDVLRPVLQTFNRDQLVACLRIARLPRAGLASPDWIFAIGELDEDETRVLGDAVLVLTRQPSHDEVMAIVRVTAELNGIVTRLRTQGHRVYSTQKPGMRRQS